jgi:hypothetical protein
MKLDCTHDSCSILCVYNNSFHKHDVGLAISVGRKALDWIEQPMQAACSAEPERLIPAPHMPHMPSVQL